MQDTRALRLRSEQLLRQEDVDAWLSLWQTSQGSLARDRRLELMATVLPFDTSADLAVRDMCWGTG